MFVDNIILPMAISSVTKRAFTEKDCKSSVPKGNLNHLMLTVKTGMIGTRAFLAALAKPSLSRQSTISQIR